MPNRWIKEAYCASSRINAVSAEARDLWLRLLVNADDHGYFHGSAQLVASACFPLQPNARKCEQLLTELNAGQLIVRYESGGKQYLAVTQWYERPRSRPKYPEPPEEVKVAIASTCEQLQTIARNCKRLLTSTSTTTTTTTSTSTAPTAIAFDAEVGWVGVAHEDRKQWAQAYPALDLDAELAKARVWVIANPKNRKSNWRRFIAGWLDRAQNRAARVEGTRVNTGEIRQWQ